MRHLTTDFVVGVYGAFMNASALFTIEDVEYHSRDGAGLLARVYRPIGQGLSPLVIEVHGGAWCRGDRLDEDRLNASLASRGVTVAAIDFRMPPSAVYPASIADINYAIRWFKLHARRFGINPEAIGLMGVSSGAHQAVLAAMRPHDARYLSVGSVDASVDATVSFVAACWPVIDPLGRYRYARDLQTSGKQYPDAIDRVIPDHLKYWGSEDAMSEGSPLRTLQRGEAVRTPPLLYLQGELDLVHPRDQAEDFLRLYRQRGGVAKACWYPGEAESFINKKPQAESTQQAIDAIADFIHEQVPVEIRQ